MPEKKTQHAIHQRIVGLDMIRAVAILLVLYGHGALLLPVSFQSKYYSYMPPIDGVSLFFVLSGFLIGGILLKIIDTTDLTRADLLDFWIRRWFRTLPNYFLVLFLLVAYRWAVFHDTKGFSWEFLLFVQNFAWPHPEYFAEAWSLSIEEWFYLLFPLLYFILHKGLKSRAKSFIYSVIFFLTAPLLARMLKFGLGLGSQDFDSIYRKIVVFRLDSLMYGIIAAYLYRYKRQVWTKYKYVCLLLSAILLLILDFNAIKWQKLYPPLYFNLESVTVLLLMPFFSELKTTGLYLADKFFTGVSLLSYALYLVNLAMMKNMVIPTIHNQIGWRFAGAETTYIADTITFWIGSFVIAWLIYYFFERHMTKLRDRIHISAASKSKTAV